MKLNSHIRKIRNDKLISRNGEVNKKQFFFSLYHNKHMWRRNSQLNSATLVLRINCWSRHTVKRTQSQIVVCYMRHEKHKHACRSIALFVGSVGVCLRFAWRIALAARCSCVFKADLKIICLFFSVKLCLMYHEIKGNSLVLSPYLIIQSSYTEVQHQDISIHIKMESFFLNKNYESRFTCHFKSNSFESVQKKIDAK